MMYLKTMSVEDLGDDDTRKNYEIDCIGPGGRVSFVRDVDWLKGSGAKFGAVIFQGNESVRCIPLRGNAYVMNAQGKTIGSHCAEPEDEPRGYIPPSEQDLARM